MKESETQPKFFAFAAASMLAATTLYAVTNVLVKELSYLPAMEIVFFRSLISALLCLPLIKSSGENWRGNNNRLLFARGTFGTLALFFFVVTVQHIPLATAVTIQYTLPIFTAVIGIFILGEKVQPLQWLFYAAAFAGIFVIKGFDSSVSLIFLVTGLLSAFCSAMALNLVRNLKHREHPIVIIFHFQLIGVIVGLAFSVFNWVMPRSLLDWFLLAACGVLIQLGQIYLTRALQSEQIAKISIISYVGIIYAFIFGIFLYHESYPQETVVGIVLVIASVVGSVLVSRYKQNRPNPRTASEIFRNND